MRRLRSNGLTASNASSPQSLLPVIAAKGKASVDQLRVLDDIAAQSSELSTILRPQAAYRWLLPYLAAITPQYVEGVLRGALAGNHVQAWELFDLMCDTDPEINACVQEYNEGVLRKKIRFEPYHEEDEEPSDSAIEKCKVVSAALRNMRPIMTKDENDLRSTMRDILAARFHGQSILEIEWTDDDTGQLRLLDIPNLGQVLCPRSTFWVHPVCYAYDMNGTMGLRAASTDIAQFSKQAKASKMGKVPMNPVKPPAWNFITSQPRPSVLVDFPKNKFLISILKSKTGTALSGSVLRPLAWWWVASNFCGSWLLNTAQLFGIPFRKAKYDPSTSQSVKNEILQMLQSMGSAGYCLLPNTAELEFESVSAGSAESPQAFLFNFANEMKRKVILHQTMVGGQNSVGTGVGKGGMETESDIKSDCINEGAKHVEAVINLQLVPMILTLNFGDGGDLEAPTVTLVDDEVGGLADAQRDQILSQIMDIPTSYLHKKYCIPKPAEGEPLAGQEAGIQGAQHEMQVQQMQNQQDMQAQQMEVQKEQAKAAQAQAAAQAQQPNAEGGEGVESRRAEITASMAEVINPLKARLEAINAITDAKARKIAMRKFLRDEPSITKALFHDKSASDEVVDAAMQELLGKLKNKTKNT